MQWALYAKQTTFDLPGYQVGKADTGWFSIYPPFSFNPLGELVASGEAQTGPDGLLSLTLPTDKAKIKDVRSIYTLEVTVNDESGLPVSARASLNLNPAAFYIGVQPDIWVGQAGSPISFDVITVDWNKKPSANRSLHAEFQKVTWVRQDPTSANTGMGPTYIPQYSPVGSTDFVTGPDGLARVQFTPAEPGNYQLSVGGESAQTDVALVGWRAGPGRLAGPSKPASASDCRPYGV